MKIALLSFVIGLAAVAAHGENLLTNASFESVDSSGKPERWFAYVHEMTGAVGTVDATAADGRQSITLYTPKPYPGEDPRNNWSQNVFEDLAGVEVEASASVRSRDVDEAAILVQCWDRSRDRLIATETSAADTPIRGTQDWTPIRFRFRVPRGTDYLTFRCVLVGAGRVWFDNVGLSRVEAPAQQIAETAPPPLADVQEPVVSAAPVERFPSTAQAVPDIAALIEANSALTHALEELRDTNQSLLGEIDELRGQIGETRTQLDEWQASLRDEQARREQAEADARKPKYGHPLVPSEYREEDEPR